MSTNVPTISVTAEALNHHSSLSDNSDSQDNSDSYSNDMDYNQNVEGGITDVEDFDSQAEVDKPRTRRSSKNTLVLPPQSSGNIHGDATDVEDYNDSDADDEEEDKSRVYPELKLSLNEFLQHDVQEHLSTSAGVKEMVEHKSGDFLQAQNLNTLNDYLTDCEDYNTDSDLENNCEKSVCVDLNETFAEVGRVNIADATASSMDQKDSEDDYEDVSIVSDIIDMAAGFPDATDKVHGMSEDELLEMSGNEEICQISCSENESLGDNENNSEEDLLSSVSFAPIDVTFVKPSKKRGQNNTASCWGTTKNSQSCRNTMFLNVERNSKEDVLTDIERFDDSVAEGDDDDSFDADDDDQQPIPQAVILAVGDDGGCQTDCEDLICDDVSETAVSKQESMLSVDINALPLPQREVVMLQEDKYGDTITNVMPMDKEYQFGMNTSCKEQCLTDSEEYSGTDENDMQPSLAESASPVPNELVEHDVTISNELLKPQQSKRLEILSNTESVTDVEEIFMAGTNSRKKKLKTRSMSKGKSKFLEISKPRVDDGGTDIEEMDLSESGVVNSIQNVSMQTHNNPDKVTDVEDMTADEISSASDAELPQIDTNTSNLRDYHDSSKNIVVTLETCGSVICPKHKKSTCAHPLQENFTEHNQQQPHTDVEDVQLPSDAEEGLLEPSAACICHELIEMLNESCTTVHEKCSNSFNVDAEKSHIKGMMLRESHTDIEYVESDESAAKGSK